MTNVQPTNAGNYSVVVTNVAGSATSSNAVLTVNVPPTITAQPTNQTVIQGSNATFNVTATGTTPLRCQWYFNGTNMLGGATNTSLTLTNVQTSNAGNYSVVVTNVAGSAASSNAVLTVNVPPAITQQPVNMATNAGGSVTFSITATGTPPLNYQWYFNSGVLANATNAVLTLTGVTTNQAGTYSVVVTNVAGSVTSSNAVLTVNVPPTISLTNPANNAVFPAGANVSLSASASDTDGTVTQVQFFQGTNSLGVITTAPYNLVWTNPPVGGYSLTAQATDNNSLIATSAVVNIIVDIPPSVAITNPANNAMLFPGSNVSLGASASDADGTISQVQFFFGTNWLGTVTNSPYTLIWTNLAVGVYSITAQATDNNGLAATSSVVMFYVVPPLTNMVAWWRAEGNALDSVGTNNGALQGGATFTNGMVGQLTTMASSRPQQ